LKTDFGGLPIAFHLTGGEASDSRNFETLLDIGPDLNPRPALGDQGYDSKSNRDAARQRGICPAIPYRSNTKDMPAFFPKALYKARARIEQAVGKLKRFKRIALRCEKTTQNYGSFVALALGFILIKSVHTASSSTSHCADKFGQDGWCGLGVCLRSVRERGGRAHNPCSSDLRLQPGHSSARPAITQGLP
jgi:transposase